MTGPTVIAQLLARRDRLMWWRRRIVQQINDTETAQ